MERLALRQGWKRKKCGEGLRTELGVSVESPLKTLESPRLQLREEVQVPEWEGWEAQQAGTELGSPSPAFMAGESFQEVWPVGQPFLSPLQGLQLRGEW